MLQKEQKCAAATFGASPRSADSMDVVVRVVGWVKLDHPINFREIKTSLSNICAE